MLSKIFHIFDSEDELADFIDFTVPNTTGSFSIVYPLFEYKMVLKVTEDEAYLEFLSFVIKNPHLKCVPVIYDHQIINGTSYILMEMLEHSYTGNEDRAESQGWYEKGVELWEGYERELDKTLDTLKSYHYNNNLDFDWDLREQNIMQRLNGDLVITDPWSLF